MSILFWNDMESVERFRISDIFWVFLEHSGMQIFFHNDL